MGRAEDRKMKRKVDKKVGKGTIDKMTKGLDKEFIDYQVNDKCKKFESWIIDSVVEAMKKNGLTNAQVKRISDDIELILKRKVHGVE